MIFKNFCPYLVGDIYVTTNSTNPSSVYLGTTWSKIEGRFLLGTSGGGTSKQTGGSMSKIIQQVNMPNIKLTVDSFSLSRGTMDITGIFPSGQKNDNYIQPSGAFAWRKDVAKLGFTNTQGSYTETSMLFTASKSWTGATNSVSPQTSALGSGQALDITPAYYTTHIWLRTS